MTNGIFVPAKTPGTQRLESLENREKRQPKRGIAARLSAPSQQEEPARSGGAMEKVLSSPYLKFLPGPFNLLAERPREIMGKGLETVGAFLEPPMEIERTVTLPPRAAIQQWTDWELAQGLILAGEYEEAELLMEGSTARTREETSQWLKGGLRHRGATQPSTFWGEELLSVADIPILPYGPAFKAAKTFTGKTFRPAVEAAEMFGTKRGLPAFSQTGERMRGIMARAPAGAAQSVEESVAELAKLTKPGGAPHKRWEEAIGAAPRLSVAQLDEQIKAGYSFIRRNRGSSFAEARKLQGMNIRVAKAERARRGATTAAAEAVPPPTAAVPPPTATARAAAEAAKGDIKLYRGQAQGGEGRYYSTDKDFAREFTQTGRESEIKEIVVSANRVLRTGEELPFAKDVDAIDQAIISTRAKGYEAFWVDEGLGQPPSVFFVDPPTAAARAAAEAVPPPTATARAAAEVADVGAAEQLKALVEPEGVNQRMYDQLVEYAPKLSDAQLDEQIKGSTKIIRDLRKSLLPRRPTPEFDAISTHSLAIRISKAEKARRAAARAAAEAVPPPTTAPVPVTGARVGGPWVYHKTNLEALQKIQQSGFTQGDFIEGLASFRKVDFPGDVSLRVRQGNLPPGQVGEYGRGIKWHLPAFADTGLSIAPENIEVYLGAAGRPVSVKAKGAWKPLTEPTPTATRVAEEGVPPPAAAVDEGVPGSGKSPQGSALEKMDEGIIPEGGADIPPVGRGPDVTDAPDVGGPAEDWAANIRLSKFPEDVRKVIQGFARANPDLVQEARRGVRSDIDVLKSAQELIEDTGGDFARLQRQWKPGDAWNVEEIAAIRGVLSEKSSEVLKVAREVQLNDSTANRLRLQVALEESWRVQQIVHGITAEAGRSLRGFRKAAFDAIGSNDTKRMEELLRRLGPRSKAPEIADGLLHLDLTDPRQVHEFIKGTMKPGWMDYIMELWINSILSGPKTHIINMLGNGSTTLTSPIERFAAAGVESILAPLQGRRADRFFSEVPADVIGAVQSIKEGSLAALQVMRHGMNQAAMSKWEFRREAFRGRLGRVIRGPGTFLEAADVFWTTVGYGQAKHALARRQVMQEGLKGTRRMEKYADLINTPTLDISKEASRIAEYRVFRAPPGEFTTRLMALRDSFPPLRFVIPFLRTPVNLFKFGLERSPLGIVNPHLWRNLAAKSPEASDQIARIALGSGIMAGVAWMFGEGTITGAAPRDRAERDRFYREGKLPYAFKVGDTWIQYQRMEPLNQPLSQVAAIIEAIHAEDKTVEEKIGYLVFSVGENLVSQTYMNSLYNFMNAVQRPGRYGERYLLRLVSGMVPGSSLMRTIAQATDPTYRKAKTLPETLQQIIPGLSHNVPAILTAFGQEAPRRSIPWSPILTSPAVQDDVDREIERVGEEIGFVGATIAGRTLSREQQQKYQELAGQAIYRALSSLFEDEIYTRYTGVAGGKLEQGKIIRKIVDRMKDRARTTMLMEAAPELVEAIEAEASLSALGQPSIDTEVRGLTEAPRTPRRGISASLVR